MITEAIMNLLKANMLWFLSIIPSVEIGELNLNDVAEMFVDIMQGVAYIFPVKDVLIMLGIWYGIYTFTIAWRVIQRIWDALPFT